MLRLHGWEEVGTELNQLSRRGEWVAMGELITDEMLETFAVVAPPDDVAAGIAAPATATCSTGSASTRPYASDPAVWTQLVADLRDAPLT